MGCPGPARELEPGGAAQAEPEPLGLLTASCDPPNNLMQKGLQLFAPYRWETEAQRSEAHHRCWGAGPLPGHKAR